MVTKRNTYDCKDCGIEVWEKAVSPALINYRQCPQCYTKQMMKDKKHKKIFIICTVRMGENPKAIEYVNKLEAEGHKVHYPPRDTNQIDDTGGFRICRDNRDAINEADEVHIFYDARSQGTHFDLGMAFVLRKKIKLVDVAAAENDAYPVQKGGKSFLRVIQFWSEE